MSAPLRVVVADDERPARRYLVSLLESFDDVDVAGEAENGARAVELIERERPDLALLDLQMPEVDGLGVVRLVAASPDAGPLFAFVTAHDDYAVRAFELNAVDYLLKPVDRDRLRATIERAAARLGAAGAGERAVARDRIDRAANDYAASAPARPLERIPVRRRDGIALVAVERVVSIVAEGELLHLTTDDGERHTITHSLRDLEARLDARTFVRLSRGALARVDSIDRLAPMPGGSFVATLTNGQRLAVSRAQSRALRESLLQL